MDKAEFLTRAAAGEPVLLKETLHASTVVLSISGQDYNTFPNRGSARDFGTKNGLDPFQWQSVSNASFYAKQNQ